MMNLAFNVQLPGGIAAGGAFGHDILQMVGNAGLMVKFVLLLLLIFSVVSWAIILMKWRLIRKAKRETARFLDLFWESSEMMRIYQACEDLTFSPVVRLFRAGFAEFSRIQKIQKGSTRSDGAMEAAAKKPIHQMQQATVDNLERSLKRATIDQMNRLERALNFLATTGNTAPFIGLFGTVWGIMESFRGIGLKGSANLAVVAPGISEALIATAAGLAAAIPAVVAFNYFTRRVAELGAEMDIFTSDFLSTVERQIFRKQVTARPGA
jgi:biopolymer transport protein TolQ